MAYESYALVLSALSSAILLFGIYYTYLVGKRTAKASVLWSLFLLGFLALFFYQFAEVLEYADELILNPEGGSPSWLHTAFESFFKVSLGAFGEDISHTMPVAAAAIFLCTALVIKRSVLVPL